MRVRSLAAVIAFVIGTPTILRADTYTVFDASGLFQQGTLSGTATLDDSSWSFTGADLTVSYLGTEYVFSGTPSPNPFGKFNGFELDDAEGDTLELYFPVISFVSYEGGGLCNSGGSCNFGVQFVVSEVAGAGLDPFSTVDPLYGGGLTDVATPTPEPSAIWLLATGLGCMGAVRRRWA